jgi:hypothetical protein
VLWLYTSSVSTYRVRGNLCSGCTHSVKVHTGERKLVPCLYTSSVSTYRVRGNLCSGCTHSVKVHTGERKLVLWLYTFSVSIFRSEETCALAVHRRIRRLNINQKCYRLRSLVIVKCGSVARDQSIATLFNSLTTTLDTAASNRIIRFSILLQKTLLTCVLWCFV